jgi:hypothetical protein
LPTKTIPTQMESGWERGDYFNNTNTQHDYNNTMRWIILFYTSKWRNRIEIGSEM